MIKIKKFPVGDHGLPGGGRYNVNEGKSYEGAGSAAFDHSVLSEQPTPTAGGRRFDVGIGREPRGRAHRACRI